MDDAFPTLIRYTGLVFTVVLITSTIVLAVTGGIESAAALSPGYVAAAGLILYKTVHNSAKEGE